jgi:hypothetical protein
MLIVKDIYRFCIRIMFENVLIKQYLISGEFYKIYQITKGERI